IDDILKVLNVGGNGRGKGKEKEIITPESDAVGTEGGEKKEDEKVNSLSESLRDDLALNSELFFEKEKLTFLYHVTKSSATLETITEKGFKVYKADDSNYDGDLAKTNAPKGIFFCATLYKGGLPTITPYPRSLSDIKGELYPRISLRIDALSLQKNYNLYFVKNLTEPKTQSGGPTRHLLVAFIHKKNDQATAWASASSLKQLELQNSIFKFDNGSWFCLKREQHGFGLWTNVFIVPAEGDSFLEQLRTAEYGRVRHN
ncbi:hypothetical protein HDV01_004592, partial [Terramyces sp. JEL0728]